MATHNAIRAWDDDGFVVLKSLLSADQLAPALAELPLLYPTAQEYHTDVDPGRNARFEDEFGGIETFPSPVLS